MNDIPEERDEASIPYKIDPEFGAIEDGERYQIEDTEETFKEWRELLDEFAVIFKEFKKYDSDSGLTEGVDYGFTDWHHGMKVLGAYIYNSKMLEADFLKRVMNIIRRHGECFGWFECSDETDDHLGTFMVFRGRVVFNEFHRINRLIDVVIHGKPHTPRPIARPTEAEILRLKPGMPPGAVDVQCGRMVPASNMVYSYPAEGNGQYLLYFVPTRETQGKASECTLKAVTESAYPGDSGVYLLPQELRGTVCTGLADTE